MNEGKKRTNAKVLAQIPVNDLPGHVRMIGPGQAQMLKCQLFLAESAYVTVKNCHKYPVPGLFRATQNYYRAAIRSTDQGISLIKIWVPQQPQSSRRSLR